MGERTHSEIDQAELTREAMIVVDKHDAGHGQMIVTRAII